MKFPIDIYADNLMLPVETLREKRISEQLITRMIRLRDIYNYMLRNPLKKDREYIDYIQGCYVDEDGKPISRRKAYEDMEILHAIVGNLQQCSKEWHRWRFNNMIMEGYAIAVASTTASIRTMRRITDCRRYRTSYSPSMCPSWASSLFRTQARSSTT